jgi:hypothetical protein
MLASGAQGVAQKRQKMAQMRRLIDCDRVGLKVSNQTIPPKDAWREHS